MLERAVPVDADGAWSARPDPARRGPADVGLYRAGDTTAYRTLLIAAA